MRQVRGVLIVAAVVCVPTVFGLQAEVARITAHPVAGAVSAQKPVASPAKNAAPSAVVSLTLGRATLLPRTSA